MDDDFDSGAKEQTSVWLPQSIYWYLHDEVSEDNWDSKGEMIREALIEIYGDEAKEFAESGGLEKWGL